MMGLTIGFAIFLGLVFFYIIRVYPYDSSKDNKIRPMGFVCDVCNGKKDKNGNPLLRCMIKPWILKTLGLYKEKPENDKIEPEWFLG